MTSRAGALPFVNGTDTLPMPRARKFEARRDELAEATLKTLSELGYARTSLREIAQNSDFSHGVLHYYFRDKVELILHGVRRYKAQCVTRYDDLVDAVEAEELRCAFARRLAETLVDDAPMHRLWYDLRTQSLFEPEFGDDVAAIDASLETMIWRVVDRYAALARRRPVVASRTAYALIDGLFERALLDHGAGDTSAPDRLADRVAQLLPGLLGDPIS